MTGRHAILAAALCLGACGSPFVISVEADPRPDRDIDTVRILPISYRELDPCPLYPSLTQPRDNPLIALFESNASLRRYDNNSFFAVIVEDLDLELLPDTPSAPTTTVILSGEFTLAEMIKGKSPAQFDTISRYHLTARGKGEPQPGTPFERSFAFDALLWDLMNAAMKALVRHLPFEGVVTPDTVAPRIGDPHAPDAEYFNRQLDRSDAPPTRTPQ